MSEARFFFFDGFVCFFAFLFAFLFLRSPERLTIFGSEFEMGMEVCMYVMEIKIIKIKKYFSFGLFWLFWTGVAVFC